MQDTEIATGIAERLLAVAFDPVSLVALALAGAAILVILFAGRAGAKPDTARRAPAAGEAPVPLLETPLQPTLAAPTPVAKPQDGLRPLMSGILYGVLGVGAFASLVAFGLSVAGGEGDPAPYDRAAADWQVAATQADGDAACAPGFDGHRDSYTHCGASVPVTFEVVGLARDGQRLHGAAWSGAGPRGFVLEAPGQPAPFTLDARSGLIPAPGSELSDYDAFVAVGYADAARDGEAAEVSAEQRGLALAELAARTVRAGRGGDCRSDVVVHAVSLGARRDGRGPAPQPLLVGVRIDDRINRPRGDMGDLNAMLDGLFASEGAAITGVAPGQYGPWSVIASERACPRSPV